MNSWAGFLLETSPSGVLLGMKDSRVALIDLDGTVVDFDTTMAKALAALKGPDELTTETGWYGCPPHIEARRELIKKQPGFWRNLPRLELGFHIVEELRRLDFVLHVLTKGPGKSLNAWTEKAEWVQANMPDAAITVTQDKSLVYGRVLVDDWPSYFEGWLQSRPRGQVVCVAHSWNEGYDKDPRVLRYDGSNRAQLREVLQKAYDRPSGSTLATEADPSSW